MYSSNVDKILGRLVSAILAGYFLYFAFAALNSQWATALFGGKRGKRRLRTIPPVSPFHLKPERPATHGLPNAWYCLFFR
jgi:hypothetical protein